MPNPACCIHPNITPACRLRQKEKLSWLEAELQRLQRLCAAHGIDPSPEAPPPVALRGGGGAARAAAATLATAAGAAPPAAAAAQLLPAMLPAAAAVAAAAAQPAAAVLPVAPAAAAPSTSQLYVEVEALLERCPAIPCTTAIQFLTVGACGALPLCR